MNMQKSHDGNDTNLDKGLNELGRAYRDLGEENPPELLDQAILNRAHREVEKKAGWMQFGWLHGLTTAAVIVLAFSIVLQQGEPVPVADDILLESTPPPIRIEPEPGETLLQVAPTAAMKLEAEEPANSIRESREYSDLRKEGQVLGDVAAAPATARTLEVSLEEEKASRERAKSAEAGAADFAAITTPQESDDVDTLQYTIPAEQQLAEILRLKTAGDESWKKELENFRQQYPDYPIPAELQD